MAFFGITNFGPQNTFAHTCSKEAHIHIFDDNDLRKSWVASVKDIKGSVNRENLETLFVHLYNGPPPAVDRSLLDDKFSKHFSDKEACINYSQFLSTIKTIQAENASMVHTREDRARKCAEPSRSNREYRHKVKAHVIGTDAKQRQNAPLSAAQEVGWEDAECKPPVAGKQGSEITKFAAELVKNGIYY